MKFIILIIIFGVAWLLVDKLILSKFKVPKIGSLVMITGGVKTGKSTMSVAIVRSEYKKRVRSIKFKNYIRKLFNRPLLELPLIYSNVPLAMPYVPLTDELLLRKKRFNYGSVIYIQEASLVADSQLIRDMDINDNLLHLFKLIAHETLGGCCVIDSQQIQDIHYSAKRSISNYFYIHHLTKWIPFFLVAYVQECRYTEDGSAITVNTEDVEKTLRRVIIPKSTWKYFDCYCYSVLTDSLEVENNVVYNNTKTQDLKARNILSLRKMKKEGKLNERENTKKSI